MAAPEVVLTNLFGEPYPDNHIDAIEDTLYPLVLAVSDPDHPTGATFDFEVTGPDADLFYVVDYQLIFNSAPDFENPTDQGTDNIYEVTVGITDGDGEHTDQPIYIHIFNDPNDDNFGGPPPQFISDPFAVVPENIDNVVYTAEVDSSGTGNAEDVVFSIVDAPNGPDGHLFSIDPVTGEVFFNEPPDFENPADSGPD